MEFRFEINGRKQVRLFHGKVWKVLGFCLGGIAAYAAFFVYRIRRDYKRIMKETDRI